MMLRFSHLVFMLVVGKQRFADETGAFAVRFLMDV
jgi:hypothetical protein